MARWITPKKRLAIYLRDDFTCAYCKRDLHHAAPEEINLDHLTCRSHGGSNAATNLITACQTCNKSRGTQHYGTFASHRDGKQGAHAGIYAYLLSRQARRPMNTRLAESILEGRGN